MKHIYICVSKLTIIGSGNGLPPDRRQAIITSNLRDKLEWNIKWKSYIFIQENAFENVVCEMAAILSLPRCVSMLSLQVTMFDMFDQD